MIAATLNAWASEMGIDQQTLERRLAKTGFRAKKRQAIPFAIIKPVLVTDKQAEEVRALQLDNAERERNALKADGSLRDVAEIDPVIQRVLLTPLANLMRSAGASLDTRCNPQNPALARKAIDDWIEQQMKPLLKVEIMKEMPKV